MVEVDEVLDGKEMVSEVIYSLFQRSGINLNS